MEKKQQQNKGKSSNKLRWVPCSKSKSTENLKGIRSAHITWILTLVASLESSSDYGVTKIVVESCAEGIWQIIPTIAYFNAQENKNQGLL